MFPHFPQNSFELGFSNPQLMQKNLPSLAVTGGAFVDFTFRPRFENETAMKTASTAMTKTRNPPMSASPEGAGRFELEVVVSEFVCWHGLIV